MSLAAARGECRVTEDSAKMIFYAFLQACVCVPCRPVRTQSADAQSLPARVPCPAATYRIAAVAHFLLSHFHVDIRSSGAILGGPLSMIDRLTAR